MNKIGQSLKRKVGPLPVWVWTIIGFGLVWYYRNKLSGGSVSGTGTGSVAPTPTTPQPSTVLQPGESIYDPGTGMLTTAPGGSTGGGGGGGDTTTTGPDWGGLIDAITAAINAGEAAAAGSGGTGSAGTGGGGAGTAPTTRATPAAAPKLTAKGAIRAPFGHNKPRAKPGYRTVGLGRGFWEYVPNKRTPKQKNQHGQPKATTKPPKPGTKTKPRSNATARTSSGGRTGWGASFGGLKPSGRTRGGAKPQASKPRTMSTRRITPVVTRPVVRQRPVASTQPRPQAVQPSIQRTAGTPARTATRTVIVNKPKIVSGRKRR